MSTQRISFTMDGHIDAIERVVRRMLDNAGYTEATFTMTKQGRGSSPKRGTVARNRTIRVPDDIWVKFQRAAAKEGKSVTDWLIAAAEAAIDSQRMRDRFGRAYERGVKRSKSEP